MHACRVIRLKKVTVKSMPSNIQHTRSQTNTQYIPALGNANNAKDETAVDIQEQQETLEPNQEMDQVEQPKQRYPVRL